MLVLNVDNNAGVSEVDDCIQCESKNPPPLRTCGNFSNTVVNFSTKFYVLIKRSYLC